MTIKMRLGLSFAAMIFLVAAVGAFLMIGGEIRAQYFRKAILSNKISSSAKEMNYYLDQQLKSFDYYVLFGEKDTKDTYSEYKKIIGSKFSEWKELVKEDFPSRMEIDELEKSYVDVIKNSDLVLKLKGQDQGIKALGIVDSLYAPKQKRLRDNIKDLMDKKMMLSDLSQKDAENIADRQLVMSMFVMLLVLLLGVGLAVYIFRYISKPLSVLQNGALEIGNGNFNYEFAMANPEDEFGNLAKSFNEMAENIRKMQSQIIQLDRMSAMGQLAGGVAHELNNPLTGVLGQAQILLSRMETTDPSREHIEKIERAAIRCRKIVRELLDFSRQKEYSFVDSDIHQIIDATLLLSETDLSVSQIKIVKHYSPEVRPIAVSQPHLQQVFLNLINNAMQAMSPGGQLTIATNMFPHGYTIQDRRKNSQEIVVPGEWLEIVFTDTGIGISEKNLQHIFDPFFTTKEVGKGTGLGLTISYGIIQNHKGVITGESIGAGKGSSFRIKLPYKRI